MKKIISLFLVFALAFALCACTVNPTDTNQAGNVSVDNTGKKEDAKTEAIAIEANQTVAVGDVFEMTLTSAEWCEQILPSNTEGAYSYYEDVNGEKYFVIHGTIKNLSGVTVDIQWASKINMLINGKYEMSGRMELEESDGTNFYGRVKPLQTLNLIIYGSASDELYSIYESVKTDISIVTDEEKLNYFYEESSKQETFTITFNK